MLMVAKGQRSLAHYNTLVFGVAKGLRNRKDINPSEARINLLMRQFFGVCGQRGRCVPIWV